MRPEKISSPAMSSRRRAAARASALCRSCRRQSPLDLHDRQLRTGADETAPRAKLESAAKGHAVHSRDHWDRYLAPDPHVCWPSGQNISRVPGRPPKARPPPESTTPRTPFCVLSFSSVATSARTSHRQGVHVVCARQAHVCEAFVQINRDTIIHEWSSYSADEGAHLPSFTNLFFSRLVCPWSRNSRHYDLRRIKDA
jgi:hypothetical protein